MHISVQYGQVTQGVQDLTLPVLSSPADSWLEGKRQKELNERGAYIHRFQDQNSINSMVAAVKKIAEDKICTPCTLLGPSLCRSYNHHVWEGCAALIFSPAMHIALAYKGDIYSNRLSNASNLNHDRFKKKGRTRAKSARLFADAVRTEFNRLGPTTSAFKGRRTKQLNLVVSAQHHAAKIQEMEKRADLYFCSDENVSAYNLDVSSKRLILELCDKHLDFKLDEKPNLKTKAQVIEFIDTVMHVKPDLAPFLRAAKIKISSFENDAVIPLYLSNAQNDANKPSHERSYAEFLKWQLKNTQQGFSFNSCSDKSTTLTPNEVLGMPTIEDLVGLLIDPSTTKSFDQALATLKHLNESGTSTWAAVAQSIPPYTHLVSHMNQGTLIQLGWSKMIIPYSTGGLREFCDTGEIRAIDGFYFKPDYFLLLHRLASSGVLLFAPDHQTVDILQIKPNVVKNFSAITSNRGKPLVYEAVGCHSIDTDTLRLFCHLDRLGGSNFNNLTDALDNPSAVVQHRVTLMKILHLDDSQLREDLNNLLATQINRIEQLTRKISGDFRIASYRAGFQDKGIFNFNSKLGSLSLTEGTRYLIGGSQLSGLFEHTGNMKQGGAKLTFGTEASKQEFKFGSFKTADSFFSIHESTNTKGLKYFRLMLDQGLPKAYIDFSFDKHARLYIVLQTKTNKHAVSTQLRNFGWTESLDQVTNQPLQALRFIIDAIKTKNEVPDERLASTIVCLSALRSKVFLQVQPATDLLDVSTNHVQMQNWSTREMALLFHEIINQIDERLSNLANRYKKAYPSHEELISKLEDLDDAIANPVKDHLTNRFDLRLHRLKTTGVNTAKSSSQVLNLPTVSRGTVNKTPPAAIAPPAKSQSTIKKLISRIKRAFKI